MFERFTEDARTVMHAGLEEVQRRQAAAYTPADLLVGVASVGARGQAALARHDLTADRLRELHDLVDSDDLDADALGRIGIDLDAVRRNVESVFGRGALNRRRRQRAGSGGGHIPFAPAAKKALELALREALADDSNDIDSGYVLLGLLRTDDRVVAEMLAAADVDVADLRATVDAEPRPEPTGGWRARSGRPRSEPPPRSAGLVGLELPVRSITDAKTFYDALLQPLGLTAVVEPDGLVRYVLGADRGSPRIDRRVLALSPADPRVPRAGVGFSLAAPDQADVQAFRNAAVLAGAAVVAEPHPLPDLPGAWSSRVRDPDGNEIEAVYRRPDAA